MFNGMNGLEILKNWPRYESGELVNLDDRYECWCGKTHAVSSVTLREGRSVINESQMHTFVVSSGPFTAHGKRVKRPAPKVYDADGAEIREGDRVWSTHLDEPHEWVVIDPHEDRDDSQTVLVSIGDGTGHARPEDLTHRAPVLAADGMPLREGEHVYHVETGAELVVKGLPKPGEYQAVVVFALPTSPASHLTSFDPDQLTHRDPVLAADGEPLEVGQTVWDTDAETDTPLTVVEVSSDLVRCEYTWKDGKTYRPCYQPDQLTHQRPDTWQRIEEDSTLSPEVYCHRNGIDISQKDGTEIFLADTVEPMARDLVRRCKALAEKENGNE